MHITSDIVRGEKSSEYAFSNDPSPHPSQNITSTLSSKKSKNKSKTVVITKHDQKNSERAIHDDLAEEETVS